MDPAAQPFVDTIFEFLAAIVIGLPILLFGRRLLWLMGGLAMAAIGLAVATLIVFLIVLSRYPTLLQAMPEIAEIAETAQANPSATTPLPAGISESLVAEASAALEDATLQFGLLILLAGLISGILGALVLVRFPRVASTLVGFVGGIFLLFQLFELYSVNLPGPLSALFALAAGIVVAIIARRNPDTSLIVLSTFIGTIIFVEGLKLYPYSSLSAIATLSLMLIGIIYQTNAMHRRRAKLKAKAALTTQ